MDICVFLCLGQFVNPVFLPPDFADSHAAYMVDNKVSNRMMGYSFEWTKKSPGWQN